MAFRVSENDVTAMAGVLSQPGGANYWKRAVAKNTLILNPDFMRFVNDVMEEVESGLRQKSETK